MTNTEWMGQDAYMARMLDQIVWGHQLRLSCSLQQIRDKHTKAVPRHFTKGIILPLKKSIEKKIFKRIIYKQTIVSTIGSNLQCGERLETQQKTVTAYGQKDILIYSNRRKYEDKRQTNLQGPALESDKHDVAFATGALVFHHPMNNEVH